MNRINEHGIEPGTYVGPAGIVVVVAIASKVENGGNVSLLSDPVVFYRDSSVVSALTMINKSEFVLQYKMI